VLLNPCTNRSGRGVALAWLSGFGVASCLTDLVKPVNRKPFCKPRLYNVMTTMSSFRGAQWKLQSLAAALSRLACNGSRARLASELPTHSRRQHLRSYASEVKNTAARPRAPHHISPSMEQAREVYRRRNRTTMYVIADFGARMVAGANKADLPDRFYTLSIILGTVALSYGSVPMYKMVRYVPYRRCNDV
jgi:hypothetical protein